MATSDYWRKPVRRNQERESFARLMAEVEAIRLRDGLTQGGLAAEMCVAPVVTSVVGRTHFASASRPAELSALIRS
jgi:hypothetical protein